jgi:hypothetical protein
MVTFCDVIGKPIHLLYYPPYHSKYNPIERCWGILELHWNGMKLVDVETMMEWTHPSPKSMLYEHGSTCCIGGLEEESSHEDDGTQD